MIVVLAVVATMYSIAAPRYTRSLAYYRAETAARHVAADLQRAQARARNLSTDIAVIFAPATDHYVMPLVPDLDHANPATVVNLGGKAFGVQLVSATFGDSSPVETVIFDGFGTPDLGGTVQVQAGDFVRTVTVDAVSGEVMVQ